jgi:hypothetical protein
MELMVTPEGMVWVVHVAPESVVPMMEPRGTGYPVAKQALATGQATAVIEVSPAGGRCADHAVPSVVVRITARLLVASV